MKKLLILLAILAFTSCSQEELDCCVDTKPLKPIVKVDYKVPSNTLKQTLIPNFDIVTIASKFGYNSSEYSTFDTGTAFADFDGDGNIDISYAMNSGDDTTPVTHFLALNDGDGNWKDGTYLLSNPKYSALSSRKSIVGDFNNDSKPDVIRPTGAHQNIDYPYIMLSNENGYTYTSLEGYQRDSHAVSSGDIDNDGDLDLVFSGETSEGILFGINDGNAKFTWKYQLDGLMYAYASEMIDMNKDGNIDLVMSGKYDDEIYGLAIFWGSGDGTFDIDNFSEVWNNTDELIGGPDDFLINDIDKDGYLDIISLILVQPTLVNSQIEVFKGSADFTFKHVTSSFVDYNTTTVDGCCSAWVWLYLDDRDNDGTVDLYDPSKYNGQHFEWNGSMFIRK